MSATDTDEAMDPSTHFDVIIVGAGPAGIFAALELGRRSTLSVLLIEKGCDLDKRHCPSRRTGRCVHCDPCDITCGWGGAGAFSDGKLTLSPLVGGWLGEYLPEPELMALIADVDKLWLEFGAPDVLHGQESDLVDDWRHEALRHGLRLAHRPHPPHGYGTLGRCAGGHAYRAGGAGGDPDRHPCGVDPDAQRWARLSADGGRSGDRVGSGVREPGGHRSAGTGRLRLAAGRGRSLEPLSGHEPGGHRGAGGGAGRRHRGYRPGPLRAQALLHDPSFRGPRAHVLHEPGWGGEQGELRGRGHRQRPLLRRPGAQDALHQLCPAGVHALHPPLQGPYRLRQVHRPAGQSAGEGHHRPAAGRPALRAADDAGAPLPGPP